jgi:hypothetical protein
MDDAYLYFTAETGDAFGASANSSKTLKEVSITEVGKGHQKFVEVWSDGGFTSGSQVASVTLLTGTTSPGDNTLMEIITDMTDAELSVAGLKAKVPLPSVGLLDYITLYFYAETALTAGGKLMARVVLNP